MTNNQVKFTETVTDAWFLRTVFSKNSDSVASYKHWIADDRKVRGLDVRVNSDIKFSFEL